jgi:hypothetical protein
MYMDSPGKYLSHALCLLYKKRHEKIIIHKKSRHKQSDSSQNLLIFKWPDKRYLVFHLFTHLHSAYVAKKKKKRIREQ